MLVVSTVTAEQPTMGGPLPLTYNPQAPPKDVALWQEFRRQVVTPVLAKLNEAPTPDDDDVANVVRFFWERTLGLANAVWVLRSTKPDGCTYEASVLLRVMYDACLQAMYIMHDEHDRAARARLYLDFYWVEKKKRIRDIDSIESPMADGVRQSPRRPQAESEINRRFDEVEANYRIKSGHRKNWYPGHLGGLAEHVGLLGEYRIVVKQLHGITHVSPWQYHHKSPISQDALLMWARVLLGRMLRLAVLHHQVALDTRVARILERQASDTFSQPDLR
jgi:hypothetical protein